MLFFIIKRPTCAWRMGKPKLHLLESREAQVQKNPYRVMPPGPLQVLATDQIFPSKQNTEPEPKLKDFV